MMHGPQKDKRHFLFRIFAVTACLIFFVSCVEKKMTLKEAKKVSVSLRQSSFVPPPRSINDVLQVLNQPGSFNKKVTESIKKKADAQPPVTDNPNILSGFYRERSRYAKDLGRARQELADIRMALSYARQSDRMSPKSMGRLLRSLGSAETRLGNFKKGNEYFEEAIEVFPAAASYYLYAESLFKIGDYTAGSSVVREGLAFCTRLQKKQGGRQRLRTQADIERMNAVYYTSLAKDKKAERHWRSYQGILEGMKSRRPAIYLMSHYYLAKNLKSQGRFIEAEIQIRKGIKGAVAHTGKNSGLTASMARFFGEILLKQGRIDDAQKMILAAIECYESVGVLDSSMASGKVRTLLGEAKFASGDFEDATTQFLKVKKSMTVNSYSYNTKISQNHNIILNFLLTGHTKQAGDAIGFFFNEVMPHMENRDRRMAEVVALRGLLNLKNGNEKMAVADFSQAMPFLFKAKEDEGDFLKTFRQKLIVESYMDLLFDIKTAGRESQYNIDASSLIFRLCEQLNTSVVKGALGASGARAAATDPALSQLVRREQDASKQISAMKQSLMNLISAESGQVDESVMERLRSDLRALTKARETLLEEIQSRFPRYAEFINPQPKGFEQIRDALKPEETIVVMVPVTDKIYLWGIPKTGPVQFNAALITEKQLRKKIKKLRESLAPSPEVFDDIPEFNLTLASDFYDRLFKPIEIAWKNSKDLLVVSPGPLGQIPFGILPVARTIDAGNEKTLLYDNYRQVPWLIRQLSITRLPSVSSLMTLRALPPGNPLRQPFIGFGDPVFNIAQLTVSDEPKRGMGGQRGVLRTRGIRKVEKADFKMTTKNVMALGNLIRLPDTSEEILSIAGVMQADETTSVFLRKRASEANVKNANLSDARILAFASHGLIPGDLDGLEQPAIALSAPEVVDDFTEDGLLKMGEILRLNLDADWVILSACNTGAADGAGAEAVSGLGRSFFYAGTRALLVTMWSVESSSAKKLTSGLFLFQKQDPNLTRARALQTSILNLIDNEHIDYEGSAIASYAHPFFWAPFIIVGDGG